MIERKRIAIYLDYAIRIPAFKQTYELFRSSLFKDDLDTTFEDELTENDYRFYWQKQVEDPNIFRFYTSKKIDDINDSELKGNFKDYFYSDEHYKRFLDDLSFNLYSNSEITSKKDINIINIAQAHLFDITLIDVFENTRKIGNTFHFLSRIRIYPRNVIFLSKHDKINPDNYFAIWNPIENKDQINNENSDLFFEWMKELENKSKEENLNKEKND